MKHPLHIISFLLAGVFCLASFAASAQQYAASVVSVTQGTANNSTGIPAPGRSNTANALGAPQNSDATTSDALFNAYSLGFGGSITLKFNQPFTRGAGADLQMVETSFGNKNCGIYPERAKVYVSQTGADGTFILADSGCLDFALELPVNLGWAQYVKVVDISPATNSNFASIGDGYDLDGIVAPYLGAVCNTGSCTGVLTGVVSFVGGRRKDGCAVAACRQNPAQALGLPNGEVCSPAPNFVSLGFGGTAVYELCYTQFDRNGADLNVWETSWGDCWTLMDLLFPEQAEFWGSNDGVTWTLLKSLDRTPCLPAGRIIRDGQLDISTMPLVGGYRTLRFIKVIDKTDRNNCFFPYYADGYDLDAIVSTTCSNPCGREAFGEPFEPTAEASAKAATMLGTGLALAPNPAAAASSVDINFTVEQTDQLSVDLYDLSGKVLQHIGGGSYEAGAHTLKLSTADLKSGIYLVRMQGSQPELTKTERLVVK